MILTREIAAIAAAFGLFLLLAPFGSSGPRRARWLAGLAIALASWVALATTLLPTADWRGLGDRLTPLGAVVGAAAVVGVTAGAIALGRAMVRRPWVWFLALAIALPVRIPVPIGGDTSNLLVPLYGVIFVGLGVVTWEVLRGRFDATRGNLLTPVALPLAAFIAISLVSTLWSVSSKEATVKAVFFYIPFALLTVLVIAWWPRARALETLAWTTAVGGGAVAILALAQYFAKAIFWNHRQEQANAYGRFFRVNGIFFDPNILGRFLVLSIVGALAYALWKRTPANLWAMGGLASLSMAGMAVTFSRSSCLQLMVGVALLAARAFRPRRVLAVGLCVALLGGIGAAVASHNVRRVATDSAYLARVSEGRYGLVKGGLKIWREEPVIGVGLGSFETYFREQLTASERRKIRVVISHNTPITVLSELGLVGFGLFAVLAAWTGVWLRRRSRRRGAEGWAAWTACAMLAGVFVHSLFYSGFFEDPYVWVLAAGAVALVGSAPNARAESARTQDLDA